MNNANDVYSGSCSYVLTDNNIKVYLTQQAHCEVPINVDYQWMACGEDEQGNEYRIMWCQYPDYDGDDDSNACNWDNYKIEKL